MSFEILYTSAPEGLRKGSQGYCTVVSTRGIPKTLAERLEMRGGYPHPFSPGDPKNPVNFSHLLLPVGGVPYHLLSRIADCGYDYSRRSNKLAHHVAMAPEELTQGGPAWVLAGENFCEKKWDGKTRLREKGRPARTDPCTVKVCKAWGQICGDPGWAGVLAANAMSGDKKTAYVVFKPSHFRQPDDILQLVVEAMALLPLKNRWQTTFSTYYTKLQSVESIRWCFVLDGSQEASSARRDPRVTLIDLCSNLGPAPNGPYVELARTGQKPTPEKPIPTQKGPQKLPPQKELLKKEALSKEQDALGTYRRSPPEIELSTVIGKSADEGGTKLNKLPTSRKRPWFRWLAMAALLIVLVPFALYGGFQLFCPQSFNPASPDPAANVVAEVGGESEQPPAENQPQSEQDSTPAAQNPPAQNGELPPEVTKGAGRDKKVSDGKAKSSVETNASGDQAEANEPPTAPESPPPVESLEDQLKKLKNRFLLPVGDRMQTGEKKNKWPLRLKDPSKLKLELIGSDFLKIEKTGEAPDKKESETNEESYKHIIVVTNSSAITTAGNAVNGREHGNIGHFELKSGELLFVGGQHISDSQYEELRSCLLRLSDESTSYICRLSEETVKRLKCKGANWAKPKDFGKPNI